MSKVLIAGGGLFLETHRIEAIYFPASMGKVAIPSMKDA